MNNYNLNFSFSTDPAHQNLYADETSPLQTCIKFPRCDRCIEFSFRRRIGKAICLSCSVKAVSAGPICNTTALGQWSFNFSDHQHSSVDLSKQHGSIFIILNTFRHLCHLDELGIFHCKILHVIHTPCFIIIHNNFIIIQCMYFIMCIYVHRKSSHIISAGFTTGMCDKSSMLFI